MMSFPDPFNEYHEMKHNSAITRQNQLEFWDQNGKTRFLIAVQKFSSLT